jgi:hypothetical protein
VKLADGAVTAVKLDTGSVTADKIAASAVGSAQLSDGSVGTAAIQDGSVTAAKIGSNAPLPPSDCSVNQIIKWNGSAWICATEGGVSAVETVSSVFVRDQRGGVFLETFVAECPAGKSALGGGYQIKRHLGGALQEWNEAIAASQPAASNGWGVTLWWENPTTGTFWEITVHAICATVS